MFSDEEPSVDDTIFQDLRLVDGSVGRTKIRGSYPIVTSDVPAALALGFRQRLTASDVDRLLSALNHCCRYYAESIMLPVTITGSGDGGIGTGAGGAADSSKAGSPGDRQVLLQESFWNPVGHDDWVKLIDGLSSYHRALTHRQPPLRTRLHSSANLYGSITCPVLPCLFISPCCSPLLSWSTGPFRRRMCRTSSMRAEWPLSCFSCSSL